MIGLHHGIEARHYHADPAPEPSLSSSVARILLDQSPRHAWHAHPRLCVEREPEEPTRQKELGSVAHKLILGRGSEVVEIEAKSYQPKAAQEARLAAMEAGKLPILSPDLAKAEAMAQAFAEQIAEIEGCAGFTATPSEVVAIARDPSGAWLRCMMDKLETGDRFVTIWDIKTTGQSAAPQAIGAKIAQMGYDLQAGHYERTLEMAEPGFAGRLRFRFAFIEADPPHLLTVAEMDSAGLAIGRKKAAAAVALWSRCMATGTWPGYPAKVVVAEYPPYAERQWLDREMNDEALAQMGMDPFLALAPWRPPHKESPMLTELAS